MHGARRGPWPLRPTVLVRSQPGPRMARKRAQRTQQRWTVVGGGLQRSVASGTRMARRWHGGAAWSGRTVVAHRFSSRVDDGGVAVYARPKR
jgi:hypothetical protein